MPGAQTDTPRCKNQDYINIRSHATRERNRQAESRAHTHQRWPNHRFVWANAVGEINGAWKQTSEELAYERSGSDRFLEIFSLFQELANYVHRNPKVHLQEALGTLVADLYSLRQMSLSVALMLEQGKTPMVEAALVKDVGTLWQQALPERVRSIVGGENDFGDQHQLRREIDSMLKIAPKLTIQGGTTEILRGIIARGLGLR